MKFLLALATTYLVGTALAKPTKVTSCSAATITVTATATVTVTPTGTACTNPTSVATHVGVIQPPAFPTAIPDYVEGLTFGQGWGHIACEQYCVTSCGPGLPSCDPSCSTKGACGNSLSTNLYLGLGSGKDPLNPQYTITATAPARSFTIPLIFLTAASFLAPQYPHINFEVRSWDKFGNQRPTQSFIIPQPPTGVTATDIRLDLLNLGIADVSKLEFLPYHAGSIGSGGSGPDGRRLADVKIDGDGFGGAIPYQVFTPNC